MLAEISFTSNHLLDQRLNTDPLTIENDVEMADVHEWIVRDKNDDLFAVYADRNHDGETMQLACSCEDGAKDIACTHGLRVIRRIRANKELVARVLRMPPPAPEAFVDESESQLVS